MTTSKNQQEIPCATKNTCSTAGKDGSGCATCPSAKSKNPNDPMALQDISIAQNMGRIKNILFVMSGKGGVGKSSVTVNVAMALAQHGKKVGILDVDLHGPSVPNLLNLQDGLEIDEQTQKLLPAKYSNGVLVLSMDSLLQDKDTAILWRGPKKTSAIRQFLGEVDWGDLDYLLIDSPPGTGDEHMTILKSIPDVKCVVVTTPQEISLADVRKAMNFLEIAEGHVLGIVENMSGLSCPNCGHDIPLFKKGGGKLLAEKYKVPFLGAIALDPATVVAADMGIPVVLLEEKSIAKENFLTLGKNVIEHCDKNLAVMLTKAE